jgi:hypothetical protein
VDRICSRGERFGDFSSEGRRTKSTGRPTTSSASPAISRSSATETDDDSSSVTSKSTSLPGPASPRAAEPKTSSRWMRCFSQNGAIALSVRPGTTSRGLSAWAAPKGGRPHHQAGNAGRLLGRDPRFHRRDDHLVKPTSSQQPANPVQLSESILGCCGMGLIELSFPLMQQFKIPKM